MIPGDRILLTKRDFSLTPHFHCNIYIRKKHYLIDCNVIICVLPLRSTEQSILPCRQMSEASSTSGVSDGLSSGYKVSLWIGTRSTHVLRLPEGLLSPASFNQPHTSLEPT